MEINLGFFVFWLTNTEFDERKQNKCAQVHQFRWVFIGVMHDLQKQVEIDIVSLNF
jgi:hypothetical protein